MILFAGIGEIIGVTDAIGAFLIGVVLGASTYRAKIERVAVPLRDIFAAFFFLSFGLALDIEEFGSVIQIVLIAVIMTFILSLGTGAMLAWMHKMGPREALNTAAIFVNRGEFTLILATLSVSAGLDPRLQPFAGLYVLVMAILGPMFAANSEKIGAMLRKRVPVRARRRPRNPMLAEEIALVEAATSAQAAEEKADASGAARRAASRAAQKTPPEASVSSSRDAAMGAMFEFATDRPDLDGERPPRPSAAEPGVPDTADEPAPGPRTGDYT